MKIYLIEKTATKKLINLGGKITLDRLNKELNLGKTILLRIINGETQTDLRLRKVPELKKFDRGYKTIKGFYALNIEVGKKDFDIFSPKVVLNEQHLRFHSLERAINMLQAKQRLNRADWLVEKKVEVVE